MARAQKSVKRFAAGVAGTSLKLAKFGAGLGAVGVAIGTVLVKRQFEAVDSLAKTADKIGISTEALAGFRLAARRSGVELKTLEKGLTNLGVRVAEAKDGIGLGVDAFDKLGLSAGTLVHMPIDKQFEAVAEALEGVENQTQRVKIAYDLFGGRATALLNTMKGGKEGLAAYAAEADRLGLSLSRVDAKKIEQANDAFGRVRDLIAGGARRVAVGLAPLVTALADKFVEVGVSIQDWAKNAVGDIGGVIKIVAKLAEFVLKIRIPWLKVRETATLTLAAMAEGIAEVLRLAPKSFFGFSLAPGAREGVETFTEGLMQAAGEIQDQINDIAANAKDKSADIAAFLTDALVTGTERARMAIEHGGGIINPDAFVDAAAKATAQKTVKAQAAVKPRVFGRGVGEVFSAGRVGRIRAALTTAKPTPITSPELIDIADTNKRILQFFELGGTLGGGATLLA